MSTTFPLAKKKKKKYNGQTMSNGNGNEGCKVRVDDQGNKLCFLPIALNPLLALYDESLSVFPCIYPDKTTATCPKLAKEDTNGLPDLRSIKRKAA